MVSPRQIELFNKFYSQYKSKADDFINKYGAEAPKVMYGRAMKLAKNTMDKENKQRIKEMVKHLWAPIANSNCEKKSMKYSNLQCFPTI